ncbi:MAG: S41 family peptidase [Bacteroidia bacterium]
MKSRVSEVVFVLSSRRSSPQATCRKTQLLGFAARACLWLRGFFFLPLFFSPLFAQNQQLNPDQVFEVVYALSDELKSRYVDEKVGDQMAQVLLNRLKTKAYNTITKPDSLALVLGNDLQKVKADFHLRVYAGLTNLDRYADSSDAWSFFNQDKLENFGLRETRTLAGGIGYFRLDDFTEWLDARSAIAGAISSLSFSDALIIDFRHNTGGAPETMYWLLSYFFDEKSKTEFTGLYFREEGKINKAFVTKKLEGTRYCKKPVVILTGPNTASAAEGFAYDMQRLGRAIIIGESTKGGAQPARTYMLPHGFRVLLPIGKAVDPDNGGNWEGKGVVPDIAVKEEAAQMYAEAVLLDSLGKAGKHAEWYAKLAYRQAVLAHQFSIASDSLNTLTGTFDKREITLLNGALYYRNTTKTETYSRLLALPGGGYTFDSETRDLRTAVKLFPKSENGKITHLVIHYPSGNEKTLNRTL